VSFVPFVLNLFFRLLSSPYSLLYPILTDLIESDPPHTFSAKKRTGSPPEEKGKINQKDRILSGR
jgi:hypothetical protein